MIRWVSDERSHRPAVLRCIGMVAGLLALLSAGLSGGVSGALSTALAAAPQSTPSTVTAVPAFRQADTVAILTVHGEIDRVTLWSLERRAALALRQGASAIVIELDTPGGDALATLDICNLIKTDFPPNSVAWVRPNAYSAGTFIALATREIVFAPNARMGDAAPVSPLMPLPATERAKIESPLLTEIVDSARRNHYDEHLARAFVTLSGGLWLVENIQTGARTVVDREEYEAIFGSAPAASSAPLPSIDPNAEFRPRMLDFLGQARGRGGPEISPEEVASQVEFEQQLPPVRAPLMQADAGQWRLIGRVIGDGELLTLTTEAATLFGYSAATIATDEELRAWFGATRLLRFDETMAERVVRFLMSLPVRIILIVIFLVSLFIEMAAPGFGVFGIAALVSLLLFLGAPWLLGIAQWWTLLLILGGVTLIVIELVVTPGLGLPGIAGGLLLLLGMVSTFISGDMSTVDGRNEVLTGIAATLGGCLIAAVFIWLLSRQMQGLPLLNRLMLTAELGPATGPPRAEAPILARSGAPDAAGTRMVSTGRALVAGEIGTTVTDLRPGGRAEFGGRIVEVLSVDGFVPRGARVRVTSIGQFEIEVEVVK